MKRLITSCLLLLLTLSFLPQSSKAQGTPSEGKGYYLGYIHPTYQNVVPGFSAGFFRVYALISSFQDNTVFISYFDPITGIEEAAQPYKMQKRISIQVKLDVSKMKMTDPGDQLKEFRACHITSRKPINVQFFSTGNSSCGSYLALPTNALGKNYVIQSWYDNPEGDGAMLGGRGATSLDKACGVFEIIAPFNGTTVSITPTSTTQGGKRPGTTYGPGATGAPQTYSVSLNRGQCYMVKSWCDNNEMDISGTVVRSDKPIFVIAGHEDAGLLGGVGNRPLEGRDYMVESMIPCEYWDTTGYVTAPLVDSAPLTANDEGPGETYRIFTCEPGGSSVSVKIDGYAGTRDFSVGLYAPPPNLLEFLTPMHYYSTNGKKFAVMQYDERSQTTNSPFPAPSMISIVPISRWRNAYLWFVPSNVDEKLQGYYVNVFSPSAKNGDSIYVSKNGGAENLISQAGLTSVGFYKNRIPDHPELKCTKYKLAPGSYYARATFPFMVYHYGNRAVDADGDLGDFDNDDNFFAYGLPVGMVLTAGIPPNMTIKVDTNCAGWHITAIDHRQFGGIKSALLLDDPFGDIVVPTDSMIKKGVNGYQYFNTSFDPISDPARNREITFTGNDSVVSFDVLVDNVSQDGYAPVYVIDNAGNPILIELRFQKALVEYQPKDTLSFGLLKVGDAKDSVIKFINLPTNKRNYLILKADLIQNDPAFKIDSVRPPIGSTLRPGDTLKIFTHFTAIDTIAHFDTVRIKTDCFENLIPIVGEGGTPLILAGDIDFGTILVGSTKCDTTSVRNVGKLPFTLTVDYLLKNKILFSLDPATIAKLPIVILPGKSLVVRFCYSPVVSGRDTTECIWGSDIKDPYTRSIDDISKLKGKAIKPGVEWDREQQRMRVLCDSRDTARVYLVNTSSAATSVTTVGFAKTPSEFTVIASQIGRNPLGNFVIEPGDSMWVDVEFKADLSFSPKYALREDILEAIPDITGDTAVRRIHFTGEVTHGETGITPSTMIDLGYVQLGAINNIGFIATNTGDSTLIINGYDIPFEITFTPALPVPLTLEKGEQRVFIGQVALNQYIDTTFTINLRSNSPCSPMSTILVHVIASQQSVAPLGFAAPPTYVVCRDNQQKVSLSNKGTVDINLRQVEIFDEVAPYVNANQFQFVANNTQTYTYAPFKTIKSQKIEELPVLFKPQVSGLLFAKVRFIYDYIDTSKKTVIDTVYAIIGGDGVLLKNTFTVKNPSNASYSAVTGDVFTVPVSITDTIELQAGVYGATFSVTYRRDLFEYVDVAGANSNISIPTKPVITNDGAGNETATFTVTSSSQIELGMKLVDIKFRVMVSKDDKSDFLVSNGQFTDQSGATLCYFDNQHIPGDFIPQYLCGDASLKEYLKTNSVKTRIAPISPNPVTPGASPKLVYRLGENNTPISIDLFDVLGNKVQTIQSTTTMVAGEHSKLINTKSLAPGTYTVRISSPNSDVTTSFVLTK